MDIALYIIAGIIILIGLVGCIIPIIPGPPISYLALLLIQFTSKKPFTSQYMWILFAIVLIVTVLDNIVPVIGTKKSGGSKWGTWGATIGLIVGFFVGPLGIILGPFIGAVIGELLHGNNSATAIKAGFGSFIGIFFGVVLKLIVSGWITYEYIKSMFI